MEEIIKIVKQRIADEELALRGDLAFEKRALAARRKREDLIAALKAGLARLEGGE